MQAELNSIGAVTRSGAVDLSYLIWFVLGHQIRFHTVGHKPFHKLFYWDF